MSGHDWPDAETAALVDALRRQSPFTPAESGPDGERLRAHAFRVMALRPLSLMLRQGLRRLGELRGTAPAYRVEPAKKQGGQ